MHYQPIQRTLRRVQSHLARLTLTHDLILSGLLLAMLFTTCVWYERQLYLPSTARGIMMWGLVDLLLLLVLVIIIRGLGTWRGWWPWAQVDAIAARVGDRLGTPIDRLLNALQLEQRLINQPDQPNADLLNQSVKLVARRLSTLDFRILTPRRYKPSVRLVSVVIVLLILAWVTAPKAMSRAAIRLWHPEQEFAKPTPFILLSLTGDEEVLGSDTVEVVFTAIGTVPQAIDLVWVDIQGQQYTEKITLSKDRYTYYFKDVHDDIRYHARYLNPAWFSSWDDITSQQHTITIIDRPLIETLSFRIISPEYTGEPVEEIGGNVADITTLVGSRIELVGTTNMPLDSAVIRMGDTEIPMSVNRQTITGSFMLEHSADLTISVVDRRGITNANPIHYSFTALPDYPPTLSIIMPLLPVDLDESMMVPVHFDISDDFGFSQAQITYQIHHPEYLTPDNQTYTYTLPELDLTKRSQQVRHVWELSQLNLVPGDEVHFQVEVYDNNVVSGPGEAVSGTMVARVPTLTDLFTRVAENSDQTTSVTESVLEDLEEVKALLEEMELALRGEERVTWDQQQMGKQILETMQDVVAAMEAVQEQLQKLGNMAEENTLFSDEILQKYDELQNLLEEIMTPELEEAMARLRDAMQEMDPERLKNALQNMQFQASEFESQLDRFLDIFRRALAEMKMDEVVQRLEHMVVIEEQLLKELNKVPESLEDGVPESVATRRDEEADLSRRMQDLAARHEEQERAHNAVRETIREAAALVGPFSPPTAQQLDELNSSDQVMETNSALREGTSALENRKVRTTSEPCVIKRLPFGINFNGRQ
jgi:hypothetical protein